MHREKSPPLIALRGVIALAAVLAFGCALSNQFVEWDDPELITQNANFNPPTIAGLANHWMQPHDQMYIPVVYSMWWSLALFSGAPSSLVFHLANLLVHILSGWVVFEILLMLVEAPVAACAGAIFFVVHPLQAEPVAWATGMKDLLSGLLSLLAIWQYLGARRKNSIRTYGFATAIFLLALLAKPSAVCVPLICGALDWLMLGTSLRRVMAWLAPWLIPGALCALLAAKIQPVPANIVSSPLWARPIVAADSLGWYFTKLISPIHLTADYSRTPSAVIQYGWHQGLILPMIGLAALLFLLRKPKWIAAALVFLLGLLPTLGLTPFIYQRYSTVADRYAYVAMLGPALALTLFLAGVSNRRWLVTAALFFLAMIALSARQAMFWHDTVALFDHTIELNPTSLAANRTLGIYFSQHHEESRAKAYYETACRFHPDDPSNHFDYANLLRKLGMLNEAIEQYSQAIALDPTNVSFLLNNGVTLAMAGRLDEALAMFAKVAAIAPDNADAFQDAGLVLESQGRIESAKQAFSNALRIDPNRDVSRRHLQALSVGNRSGT
jgi:protein O-mannosyl-transferase